jgi:hypothetical protein
MQMDNDCFTGRKIEGDVLFGPTLEIIGIADGRSIEP